MCVPFNLSHSLSLSLTAFFIIVSQIGRSKLYCNSVAITKENFNNSTIFCQVIGGIKILDLYDWSKLKLISLLGAVFHYFTLNIALWWFFHVCSIFYKIMFPLTAKQYEKKEKYFHIVLLVTGMLYSETMTWHQFFNSISKLFLSNISSFPNLGYK